MKAVLFDLDNTLYPEIDFVRSGFRAVARYLDSCYHLDEQRVFERAWAILGRDGRGKVFDTLLQEFDLYSDARKQLLVYLYRSHRPHIRCYDDVADVFTQLRALGMRLGIITDGMGSVQENKIQALGLCDRVDLCLCTDALGSCHWKPSVLPFQVALEFLQVPAHQAVYVGDDPSKDFVGPNSLGMLTIRICRPGAVDSKEAVCSHSHAAHHVVTDLTDIMSLVKART
jgi:putative hydrolase of the HAD superfamily